MNGTTRTLSSQGFRMQILSPASPPASRGEVRLSRSSHRLLVTFSGECDVLLREPFAAVLTQAREAGLPVEIDLHEVSFFGAWGVHALLDLQDSSRGPLRVLTASTPARLALAACAVTLPGPFPSPEDAFQPA